LLSSQGQGKKIATLPLTRLKDPFTYYTGFWALINILAKE